MKRCYAFSRFVRTHQPRRDGIRTQPPWWVSAATHASEMIRYQERLHFLNIFRIAPLDPPYKLLEFKL